MAADISYEQLLAGREVIVVCGPGGVGKTTVAASTALLAAQHVGGRVLVLTVDPARRLATALGLGGLGAEGELSCCNRLKPTGVALFAVVGEQVGK